MANKQVQAVLQPLLLEEWLKQQLWSEAAESWGQKSCKLLQYNFPGFVSEKPNLALIQILEQLAKQAHAAEDS